MPISADNARPTRTVDTLGRTVSTDMGTAAPMKTLDSVGRPIEAKAEAAKVAEAAANANPDLPKTEGEGHPDADKVPEGGEAKAPTDADARREYLAAQKERRKAQELYKTNQERIRKAEAWEKALAEADKDPTALLRAAGKDPVQYYRDLTSYALSEQGKKEEDPRDKAIREHQERLNRYEEENKKLAQSIKDREELAAHNQVISSHVVPLLQQNAGKYEALVKEYGANAALEVYKVVWENYQKDGTVLQFADAADEMEKYWRDQIRSGLTATSELDSMSDLILELADKIRAKKSSTGTDAAAPQTISAGQTAPPRPTATLSNKPSAPAPLSGGGSPIGRRYQTREERVAEILKRHGG